MRILPLLSSVAVLACCELSTGEDPTLDCSLLMEIGIVSAANDGNSWDADQSAPDPLVCVTQKQEEFCTQADQNTLFPEWFENAPVEGRCDDTVEFDIEFADADGEGGAGDVICEAHYHGVFSEASKAYCCGKGMFTLRAPNPDGSITLTTVDRQQLWDECILAGN